MNFYLKMGYKKIFFILFFACFSFKSLSLEKNADISVFSKDLAKTLIIDKNYFQVQADILYLKSEMAYYNHQTVQAIDYLKEAILQAPQSLHLKSRLARIYSEENLFAEATKQYQALIEQASNNEEFRFELAKIYSLIGLNKEALKTYQDLSAKSDHKFFTLYQQAILLIDEKSWPSALKVLNQAAGVVVTEKEKGEVLFSKAYIYERLDNKSKQEQVFKQILSLDVVEEEDLLKVVEFYRASKQVKKAIILLRQYQEKNELSIPVTKTLFTLYLSTEQLKEAYTQLHHLKELGSLESTHYFFTVSFLISKNKYAEAIPFIKDLVKEYPATDYYRYLLGSTYEKNKEWKKSINEYKQIQKVSSYFLEAQMEMGQIWKDHGESKMALDLLEKIAFLSTNIKEPRPLLLYAQYLWEEGQKDQAILSLTKGSNIFFENTDILFLRGFYFEKSGKTQLALKDMEKVLELNDGHGEALNFIAYTYAEQKQKLDRAETLAFKALSLNSSSSYFLDTLGWVLFQKGEYKKSLSYLNQAFSHNKQDRRVMEHLGEVHYKLKNIKKCEHFFKQVLELERDGKKRLQIQKRLASLSSHI